MPASAPVWTPDALIHYPLIAQVALDPVGARGLYTVRRPYLTDSASEFRHTLYRVDLVGDPTPRPLTGDADAAQPQWSPNGQWIAFLRPAPDTGKPGVWVMPADGGEAWPLTGVANGIRHAVTALKWRPDGQALALLTVPWDDAREQALARRDDVRHWRADYAFSQLYQVAFTPTPGSQPPAHALTGGRQHVFAFDWRPDSGEIAYLHRSTPYIDSWPDTRLATVGVPATPAADAPLPAPADHGEVSCWESDLAYSPDGAWIACEVGHEDHGWPYANRIHLFPVGGGDARILADVVDDQPAILGWSPDSRAVYVQAETGTTSAILALPADGSAPRLLFAPDGVISATHINDRGHALLVLEDRATPQAVYALDLPGEVTGEITGEITGAAPAALPVAQPHTAAFPSGPLPHVVDLQWQTPDGFTIEGMLYLPQGYDPARDGRIPLLLHIHGGPMSIFQRQFAATPYYYTPAALCEQGIAVLRCNPRGSGGYGKTFRYANLQDWGGGDFRDLMQGVDEVIERGIADPARLGICGWSYGGYMSSWAITQTDRFAAASIGAPVTNLISFIGTADIPSFIPGFFGGEFWEQTELMIARSPLFQAHKAKTPAILQHGDADERVPLEQGQQYAMALERNGVPVALYIYPRQGHAINEPRLLADAIRRNLAWFTAKLTGSTPTAQPHA